MAAGEEQGAGNLPVAAVLPSERRSLPWLRFEPRGTPVVHAWPATDESLVATLGATDAPLRRVALGDEPPGEGILAVSAANAGALNLLENLRRSSRSRLRPVILIRTDEPSPLMEDLSDTTVPMDPAALRVAIVGQAELSHRVDAYPAPGDLTDVERRELDLVRFIDSRALESVDPVLSAVEESGFAYPLAGAILGLDPLDTRESLDDLAEAQYLRTRVCERLFLCASCGSSRLVLRELCPNCSEPALFSHPTLHHFRCAHVGSVESFERQGLLVCPKCNRRLLHIGVDYDRPEAEQRCSRCQHYCMEGLVEARCLQCAHRATPDEEVDCVLNGYEPTTALFRAAQRSVSPLSAPARMLADELGRCDLAAFEFLLDHTRRIASRYKRPAAVITVRIEDLEAAQDQAGTPAFRRHLKRLAREIQEILRTTDAVAVDGQHKVRILLTETSREDALHVFSRLQKVLDDVSAGGLRSSMQVADIEEVPADG